jgi:hypothetical protein
MQENESHSTTFRQKVGTMYWYFQLSVLFVAVFLVVLSAINNRTSAYLFSRSVQVSSSLPGANTSQLYNFDLTGTPTIGSWAFEYCSNSPLRYIPCIAPSGMSSSGAVLAAQSGETGFTIHPDTTLTPNRVILTRTPIAATPGPKIYNLNNITNPTGSLGTVFVRISSYATTDATGPHNDEGAVTYSIQNPLTVSVYVPPFLILCTGVTVSIDCTSSNGVTVDMGELSKVAPNTATTQFSVATNSFTGYVASMQGSPMTAGNQVIPALTTAANSQVGVGQFGINLRQNTLPGVGNDIEGNGSGAVNANYATPNLFRFQNGDVIASSSQSTEFNRYTISYLVNIPNNQAAGRYASTITVIATTTF